MPKGTFFRALFDKDVTDGNLLHLEYGGLRSLNFTGDDNRILQIDDVNDRQRVYTLFSIISKVALIQKQGNQTIETRVAHTNPLPLSMLIQVFNSTLVDNIANQTPIFNPSRILPRLDVDPHDWLIRRTQLDIYIRDLARKRIVQIAAYPNTPLHRHIENFDTSQLSNAENLPDFRPMK